MTRPLRISIHALGGQGGGVLAGWVVDVAERAGWIVQATSVAGVAQRTGSTIYYLEVAPPGEREPVMALMPWPGDVDIVIAAELMEAGRAIARGLVTPERTLLIASSHRVFAISEKSALGDGILPSARVVEAAQTSARRLVLADFAAMAEARGSVISSSLLGALAGSGALPFPHAAFESAIRRSGRAMEASLAAFDAGFSAAAREPAKADAPVARNPVGERPAPERLARLPAPARPIATIGAERLTDYQDRAYACLYLDRVEALVGADTQLGGDARGWLLSTTAARHLALWMSFEDVFRVADLKTRPARMARTRGEAQVPDDASMHVTEFLHPRFEEVCDSLPARLGARMMNSQRARRWLSPRLEKGRFVTTTRLRGFLLMWGLARLRRTRPRTLRYRTEQARIEGWLESAVNAARSNYELGAEVLRLQNLVKGYGDTHARGWRNFRRIMDALPRLAEQVDGAGTLRRLHDAALKDEEGRALRIELESLCAPALEAAA